MKNHIFKMKLILKLNKLYLSINNKIIENLKYYVQQIPAEIVKHTLKLKTHIITQITSRYIFLVKNQ